MGIVWEVMSILVQREPKLCFVTQCCLTDFGCDSWELDGHICHLSSLLPRPCQLNTDERVLFNQLNILSTASRQGYEDSMNKI